MRLGDALSGPSNSPLAGLEGFTGVDPVKVSAQFAPVDGDRPAVLAITAEIMPEWHVYSLTQPPGGPTKTKIEVLPSPQFKLLGDFRSYPAPTTRVDNDVWVGLKIEEHDGQVTWYVPIELAKDTDPATLAIMGRVRMLACRDSCIPVNQDFIARLGTSIPFDKLDLSISEPTAPSGPAVANASVAPNGPLPIDPATISTSFKPEGSEVHVMGQLIPAVTRASDKARLEITLIAPLDWHIYAFADRDDQPGSKPTLIAFTELSGLKAGRPVTGEPVTTDDSVPEFGTMRYYTRPVTWQIPIEVPAGAKAGEYPIRGVIAYQACETRGDGMGSCELPRAVTFETKLVVGDTPGSAAAPVKFASTTYKDAAAVAANWAPNWSDVAHTLAPAVPPQGKAALTVPGPEYDLSRIQINETHGSLGYYILLAFAGGIILNLMPCVLPVIGLKVMSFVQQSGHHRAHALVLNIWYAVGIVSVFLLLGILAWSIGLSWGGQFGNVGFTVTIAAIVFAMALSLLGVWEIPIPGFFGSGAVQDVAAREGPFGAFVKGAITTVLATPCTGPFMASAIAWAVTQPLSTILLVFGSLGLGMSSPYLLIGVFPELLRFLPKPGAWMETFKQLTGFLLLGTVVFILSFMEPFAIIPTLALLLGVAIACWLVSRTPLTAALADRLQSWALAGAVVLAAGVVAFGWLYARDQHVAWQPFSLAALQKAAVEEGQTVLVDFSADWCVNCKVLEKAVLHTDAVEKAIADSGAATMYADYTDYPPEIERTIRALKSNGVPVIAIFPGGRPYEPIVFRDGYTAQGLISALKQAESRKGAAAASSVAAAGPAVN